MKIQFLSWIIGLLRFFRFFWGQTDDLHFLRKLSGLPWWLRWYRIHLQCGRPGFNPWVGKIPWRKDSLPTPVFLDFPCGWAGKNSTCNAGDLGSIPGLGRSPGGGHGNPFQYSCLENPHGQRSLVGYSPRGHKQSDMTKHSTQKTISFRDFPGGPVVKIPWSPCRGHGFSPLSGTKIPHATWYCQKKKKKVKINYS